MHDVTLTDEVDTSAFEVVFGNLPAHWGSIGPGGNATHVLVLTPKHTGPFNFTAATLVYKPAVDADPVVRGDGD